MAKYGKISNKFTKPIVGAPCGPISIPMTNTQYYNETMSNMDESKKTIKDEVLVITFGISYREDYYHIFLNTILHSPFFIVESSLETQKSIRRYCNRISKYDYLIVNFTQKTLSLTDSAASFSSDNVLQTIYLNKELHDYYTYIFSNSSSYKNLKNFVNKHKSEDSKKRFIADMKNTSTYQNSLSGKIKFYFYKKFKKNHYITKSIETEKTINDSQKLQSHVKNELNKNIDELNKINKFEVDFIEQKMNYESLGLTKQYQDQNKIINLNKELIMTRIEKLSCIYEKIHEINISFHEKKDTIEEVRKTTETLASLTKSNILAHQNFIGQIENLELNTEYFKEMKKFSSDIASTDTLNALLILTEENLMNLNDTSAIKELEQRFNKEKNNIKQIS